MKDDLLGLGHVPAPNLGRWPTAPVPVAPPATPWWQDTGAAPAETVAPASRSDLLAGGQSGSFAPVAGGVAIDHPEREPLVIVPGISGDPAGLKAIIDHYAIDDRHPESRLAVP